MATYAEPIRGYEAVLSDSGNISYENVTMREDDALNRPVCAWARRNRERFPIDSRPIKRVAAEAAPC